MAKTILGVGDFIQQSFRTPSSRTTDFHVGCFLPIVKSLDAFCAETVVNEGRATIQPMLRFRIQLSHSKHNPGST